MTSYTKKHASQLRAVTIAGEIANIIKQIEQNAPLFTVPVSTFAGGTSGGVVGGTCGLTFNPSTLTLTAYPNSGTLRATVNVTSSITQTITFTASVSGNSCFGPPSVSPSTVSFTANQTVALTILIPTSNCSVGTNGTITFTATSDNGCVNNTSLQGNITTKPCPGGTITVSVSATGQTCAPIPPCAGNVWACIGDNCPNECVACGSFTVQDQHGHSVGGSWNTDDCLPGSGCSPTSGPQTGSFTIGDTLTANITVLTGCNPSAQGCAPFPLVCSTGTFGSCAKIAITTSVNNLFRCDNAAPCNGNMDGTVC